MDNGVTLFDRFQGSESQDDTWDDSALIEAYDKAVSAAKVKINRKLSINSQHSEKDRSEASFSQSDYSETTFSKKATSHKKKKKRWSINDPCSALYHVDNLWYEATIVSINRKHGQCTVRFVGYENEEIVPLRFLRSSGGPQKREQQTVESKNIDMDNAEECTVNAPKERSNNFAPKAGMQVPNSLQFPGFNHFDTGFTDCLVPPPPPPQIDGGPSDALHSMLLAWYMSGYHTGYYHGLRKKLGFDHQQLNQSMK